MEVQGQPEQQKNEAIPRNKLSILVNFCNLRYVGDVGRRITVETSRAKKHLIEDKNKNRKGKKKGQVWLKCYETLSSKPQYHTHTKRLEMAS
jgi:hypothetical protein